MIVTSGSLLEGFYPHCHQLFGRSGQFLSSKPVRGAHSYGCICIMIKAKESLDQHSPGGILHSLAR